MNTMKLFATCGIAAALTVGIAYAAPMQDSKKESKKEAAKEMAKEVAMVGKAAPAALCDAAPAVSADVCSARTQSERGSW